jgi:hypothetical protein
MPPEVEVRTWDEFLEDMRARWRQGEHWAIVAPTGEGKTTFAASLLRLRRYVLAVDWKGGDRTIARLGWPRVTKLPLAREHRRRIADGEPCRLVVGNLGRDRASRARRRNLVRELLEMVMQEGGWTLFIPDLAAVAAAKFGGAADDVQELLVLIRDAHGSVITDWQRPAGVPREAGDQASYLAVGYTRDVDAVARLAEMMGRSRVETRGAVSALGELPFGWLVVSRRPRHPLILTATRPL